MERRWMVVAAALTLLVTGVTCLLLSTTQLRPERDVYVPEPPDLREPLEHAEQRVEPDPEPLPVETQRFEGDLATEAGVATLVLTAVWEDDGSPACGVRVGLRESLDDRGALYRCRDTDFSGITQWRVRSEQARVVALGEDDEPFDLVKGSVNYRTLRVKRGCSLRVRVKDEDGLAIEGARILVCRGGRLPAIDVGRTDRDGVADVSAVQARCWVTVEKDGFAPTDLVRFESAAGDWHVMDFTPEGPLACVEGLVIDEQDRPVSGAAVRVCASRDLNHERGRRNDGRDSRKRENCCGISAADGAFRIPLPPSFADEPGRLKVTIRHPDLASWLGHWKKDEAERLVARLLRGGPVRGVVTGSSGAGLPGVLVWLTETESSASCTARTKADGSFLLRRAPPGGSLLMVSMGRIRDLQPVEIFDGEVTRADLSLDSPGALLGRVVDEMGRPLARWQLRLYENGEATSHGSAWTDGWGAFRLVVAPGDDVARLFPSREYPPSRSLREISLTPDSLSRPLDIEVRSSELQTGRLVGTVTPPGRDMLVLLVAESDSRSTPVSSGDGHVDTGPVAAGTYDLALSQLTLQDGKRRSSIVFVRPGLELRAGTPVRLKLRMPRPASLLVTAFHGDGWLEIHAGRIKVCGRLLRTPFDGTIPVPPGELTISWSPREGPSEPEVRRLRIDPGQRLPVAF